MAKKKGSRRGGKWQEQFARDAFAQILAKVDKAGGGARIAFTMSRSEMHAHFMRRATHHTSEALAVAQGTKKVPIDYMAGRHIGTQDFEQAKKDARVLAEQNHRDRAAAFVFMADHLPDVESFTIDEHQLTAYEFVPSMRLGVDAVFAAGMGPG